MSIFIRLRIVACFAKISAKMVSWHIGSRIVDNDQFDGGWKAVSLRVYSVDWEAT